MFPDLIFAEFWTFQIRFRSQIQKNADTYSGIFQKNQKPKLNLATIFKHNSETFRQKFQEDSDKIQNDSENVQKDYSDLYKFEDLFLDFKPPFDHYIIRHAKLGNRN